MREKLIELFFDYQRKYNSLVVSKDGLADHLISNGVTVQKWIPVTERLPENDYGKHWKERKYYIVRLQGDRIRVARYGYKEYEWWVDSHDCVLSKDHYTEVTHWMEAPQPPK